jgi:hypothetical protein
MVVEKHDDVRDLRMMMRLCLVLAALVAIAVLTAAIVQTPIALLDPPVPAATEVV